ncbi:class I SAM-dependent rRNA methyltransferase [Hydrogenophaga crocea]|uniref:23S rRNA (Cytosine(1962)-C(5))-methyltransferase RlmI n=1 Tax=Hydrogenophaga crocea TaxID=2716225 RepID=A0A6G8IIC0_9BURK|nr:class I SAM-dependent methyltransferase [Hydrogenophaga crocea]QIM52944.1 23S rRNA (cytosine(1962)-C(5))-methyltransferase RlmI [Hydrogenophaga crocea]
MKTIRLKPGKERSLLRRHPWVFDGAVAKGSADPGETVRVDDAEGRFLAWGACSPASKIRVRAWSFEQAQRIDAAFFRERLRAAIALRERLAVASDGVRLVHAEADGLPGLVVDRYGDTLVAQFGAAGVERWKGVIADALLELTGLSRLYERSDTSSRQLEGLPEATGWLRGGGDTALVLQEHGWKLGLDVALGHKTGYYLDQRDNRGLCRELVQRYGLAEVLNCYSYTGGFTVAALAGGAQRVVSVDSSGPALQQAAANVALNGLDAARCEWLDADVNATLRRFVEQGRQFDAIVLDPPKLAPTAAHAERAARAYKDINRLGFKLLKPGGLLLTFSCSGGVGVELFHKIVASAGIDAGVDGVFLQRMGGAPDHPMTVQFPEGEYLKGLVVMRRPTA